MMTKRSFLHAALVLLLSLAGLPVSSAAGPPAAEEARIHALIAHVENLKAATFIRNGKDYDAASAAKFLRAKWKANRDKIHSAADFIAQAATKSSTTGKLYRIRFKDGKEVPCGKHLNAELAKMRGTLPARE